MYLPHLRVKVTGNHARTEQEELERAAAVPDGPVNTVLVGLALEVDLGEENVCAQSGHQQESW